MATNETSFDQICPQLTTACIVTFSFAVFFFISTVILIIIVICLRKNKGSLCPINHGEYRLLDQEKANQEYEYDQQRTNQKESSDIDSASLSHQAEREPSVVVIHSEYGSTEKDDEDNLDKQQMVDKKLEAHGKEEEGTSLGESEDINPSKTEQVVESLNTQTRESAFKTANSAGRMSPDVEEAFNPRDDEVIPIERNEALDFEKDDRKCSNNNKSDLISSNTDINKSGNFNYVNETEENHDNIAQETEAVHTPIDLETDHPDTEVEDSKDIELVSPTYSANVRIKVQVLSKGIPMEIIEELMSKLCRYEELRVDPTYLSDIAEVDPDSPLLITCLHSSRLGTDAGNAIKGIRNPGTAVLLMMHHRLEYALPAQRSNIMLTESHFTSFGGIFDMAFSTDSGIYACDMNTECISNTEGFLRKFVES